jgi:ABC-type nitrate/sulfonate/bicarbonate transport system substrate-binding protein
MKAKLKAAAACVALLLALTGVAACGDDDDDSDSASGGNADVAALAKKFGVEQPKATVNFAMMPFGDHMIHAVGIENGWFDDVGIEIPGKFQTVAFEQAIPLVINNDYDITTQWGPTMAQNMASAKNVEMGAFGDTHDGVYILAPPNTDYKTLGQLTEDGVPFEEAMQTVMQQFVGKKLAIDDTGAHRTFIDGIFEIGGISVDDLEELVTVDDGRMLVLARGGQIDFAKPLGGAQETELLVQDWYPVISAREVIEALPPGDPRGVSAVGNTGVMMKRDWYEQNKETFLRFASVMYRSIDALEADLENDTDDALSIILPVLESAAGVDLDVDGLKILYGDVYSFYDFEDAADYWVDESNPFYFESIYTPQIEAAQEGGVLPKDQDLPPSEAFGIGQEVYQELANLKQQYDELLPEADGLEGDAAKLAQAAATQYENRNYLDAERWLRAAVEGQESGGS